MIFSVYVYGWLSLNFSVHARLYGCINIHEYGCANVYMYGWGCMAMCMAMCIAVESWGNGYVEKYFFSVMSSVLCYIMQWYALFRCDLPWCHVAAMWSALIRCPLLCCPLVRRASVLYTIHVNSWMRLICWMIGNISNSPCLIVSWIQSLWHGVSNIDMVRCLYYRPFSISRNRSLCRSHYVLSWVEYIHYDYEDAAHSHHARHRDVALRHNKYFKPSVNARPCNRINRSNDGHSISWTGDKMVTVAADQEIRKCE
jgi:hypothetical protein